MANGGGVTTKGLSLEEAVMQIANLVDERSLRIAMKPTKIICYPKDLQMMNDILDEQKRAIYNYNFMNANAKPTHAEKLEHAIAWLGDHYVFHKDNQVKKFKRPVPLCSDPWFLK